MLNRDSVMFWLLLAVAVVGYLVTAATPPTEWGYTQWLQAASFVLAWVVGKLGASPLAGNDTPKSRQEPAFGGLLQMTKEAEK